MSPIKTMFVSVVLAWSVWSCATATEGARSLTLHPGETVALELVGADVEREFELDVPRSFAVGVLIEQGSGWQVSMQSASGITTGCTGRLRGYEIKRCGPLQPGRYRIRIRGAGGIRGRASWLWISTWFAEGVEPND